MDKFVIRQPKPPKPTSSNDKSSNSKQLTLFDLKGVVVLEELKRSKIILEREDTSLELKIDTLKKLGEKNPSKEVLIKTKLGKTVHKLCKNKDKQLAAEASIIYKKWKAHILSFVDKPFIEVKCDLKSENFRKTARQMMNNALSEIKLNYMPDTNNLNEDKPLKKHKDLAEHIERELYKITKHKINNSYRRTVRKLVFSIKYNEELRNNISDGTLSVDSLIRSHNVT